MYTFLMRSVAFRRDTSMHIRGRIMTDRAATHEKRIRVGRAVCSMSSYPAFSADSDAITQIFAKQIQISLSSLRLVQRADPIRLPTGPD